MALIMTKLSLSSCKVLEKGHLTDKVEFVIFDQ